MGGVYSTAPDYPRSFYDRNWWLVLRKLPPQAGANRHHYVPLRFVYFLWSGLFHGNKFIYWSYGFDRVFYKTCVTHLPVFRLLDLLLMNMLGLPMVLAPRPW